MCVLQEGLNYKKFNFIKPLWALSILKRRVEDLFSWAKDHVPSEIQEMLFMDKSNWAYVLN